MDDIKGFLAPFSVSEGLPEPFFPDGPHVCLVVEFFRNLEREMEKRFSFKFQLSLSPRRR
jgi:hypothetical protein